MPISQYTQPAQGYYQPSYVAPPIQELGAMAGQMQKEQDAYRQAAQQFIGGLGSGQLSTEEAAEGTSGRALGIGGGDARTAKAKANAAKQAINQLAEEEGYNLRSPGFKNRFQNVRSEILSDPFWGEAKSAAQEAAETRERLEEYGYQLPSWKVNQIREQLAEYETEGAVTPEGRRTLRFSTVPEEMADPNEYIRDVMLDDIREDTLEFGQTGVLPDRVGRMLGYVQDEESDDLVLRRIPNDFRTSKAGRALSDQAEYIARQQVKAGEAPEMSRDLVNNIERALYDETARRVIAAESGIDTNWSAVESRRQAQQEQAGASMFDIMYAQRAEDLMTKEVQTFDQETMHRWMNTDDKGRLDLGQFAEESSILPDLGLGRPEDLANIQANAEKISAIDEASKLLGDVSKKGLTPSNLKSSGKYEYVGYMGAPTSSSQKSSNYNKLAKAYELATDSNLEEDYGDIPAKMRDETVGDTEKKELLADISRDIKEGIKSAEESLPEGIREKADKYTKANMLGKELAGLEGKYKYEPAQVNNKILTREGQLYSRGTIEMSKNQAENMIERAEDKHGTDLPSLKDLVDSGSAYIEEIEDSNGNTKEIVRINLYTALPDRAEDMTNALTSELIPVTSGQPQSEEYARMFGITKDVRSQRNALRELLQMQQNRGKTTPSRRSIAEDVKTK